MNDFVNTLLLSSLQAWLWRLVTIGSNGSMMTTAKAPDSVTRFEANAVCLTKNGVSVAQPAVLQVRKLTSAKQIIT